MCVLVQSVRICPGPVPFPQEVNSICFQYLRMECVIKLEIMLRCNMDTFVCLCLSIKQLHVSIMFNHKSTYMHLWYTFGP